MVYFTVNIIIKTNNNLNFPSYFYFYPHYLKVIKNIESLNFKLDETDCPFLTDDIIEAMPFKFTE